MAYNKPVCECGGELEVTWQEVLDATRKINKDGRVSKREYKSNAGYLNFERLTCIECGNMYEAERDSKGRVFKGKPW